MNVYTVSRLVHDVGVSVHVVRESLLRGLLHPAARTAGFTLAACMILPFDSE